MADGDDKSRWLWGFDVAVKVVVPVLIALCTWTFQEIRRLDTENVKLKGRVQVIESTRYTKTDAAQDLKDRNLEAAATARALAEIKIVLARMESQQVSESRMTQARLGKIESKLEKR